MQRGVIIRINMIIFIIWFVDDAFEEEYGNMRS